MVTILEPARPGAPDPTLLREAFANAPVAADLRNPSWVVGPRMSRRQSTLFPLTLTDGERPVLRAFYKVHRILSGHAPAQEREKLATFRRVLQRGPQLREQYMRLSGGGGMEMPAYLAVDVDRLTEVQTALPGRKLPIALLQDTPAARSWALRLYRTLGAAVAVIERCQDEHVAQHRAPVIDVDASTRRLAAILGARDTARVKGLFRDLYAEACDRGRLSYSHGDITKGNILVTRQRAGLIDALWSVRWTGDDIAYHAARLYYELPQLSSWTQRLVTEMLTGYGDLTLPAQPEWQLTQLRAAAAVAVHHPRHVVARMRRRRAVELLLRAVGPPLR